MVESMLTGRNSALQCKPSDLLLRKDMGPHGTFGESVGLRHIPNVALHPTNPTQAKRFRTCGLGTWEPDYRGTSGLGGDMFEEVR
jgi:hypothetical protein